MFSMNHEGCIKPIAEIYSIVKNHSSKLNGKILLSGLLEDERENILSSFAKNNLNIVEEVFENEWIAFCIELRT